MTDLYFPPRKISIALRISKALRNGLVGCNKTATPSEIFRLSKQCKIASIVRVSLCAKLSGRATEIAPYFSASFRIFSPSEVTTT